MSVKKTLQKLVQSLVFTSFVVMGVSCSKNVELESVSYVPYASENELLEISSSSSDYVDYKIARKLAMLEMAELEEENGWSVNAVLSERPVLIWKNSTTPQYYEFVVFDNGINAGYVTCNVSKKSGDPVAFMNNNSREFTQQESRSVISSKTKIFAENYPFIKIEKSISRTASELEENKDIPEEEFYKLYLDSLSDELIEESGTTREDAYDLFIKDKKSEEERLEMLWSLIDEQEENLLNLTDEEILKAIKEVYGESEVTSSRATIVSSSSSSAKQKKDYVFLEPYSSKDSKRRILDYCVPSVVEFICQGYKDDNGLSISDSEIANIISDEIGNDVFYSLFEENKLRNALSRITDGKLTQSYSLFHNFDSITEKLKNNKLPVISNRSGGTTVFGIFVEGHARCVTGTCKVQNAVEKKFLWIKWTDWKKTEYYYLWDNGYELKKSPTTDAVNYSIYNNKSNNHFWEKNGTWFYAGTNVFKAK